MECSFVWCSRRKERERREKIKEKGRSVFVKVKGRVMGGGVTARVMGWGERGGRGGGRSGGGRQLGEENGWLHEQKTGLVPATRVFPRKVSSLDNQQIQGVNEAKQKQVNEPWE